MPQRRNTCGQPAQAGLSAWSNLFPQSGHWVVRASPLASVAVELFRPHMCSPYPTPRMCIAQRAPPPTSRASTMVNAMMAAARFHPSSLPSTATVATHGM